jgi:hypothetical protein
VKNRYLTFTSGEHAKINGTSATHANPDRLIGGCITVSITALPTNADKTSKKFFIFASSEISPNGGPALFNRPNSLLW